METVEFRSFRAVAGFRMMSKLGYSSEEARITYDLNNTAFSKSVAPFEYNV